MALNDKPWIAAPGPAFATHAIYIVEPSGAVTQDPETGLPVEPVPTVTLMAPAPRVRLGAVERPGPGGALVREGDAEVTNISREAWTMERLLAAQGFRIGSADGELYQLMGGSLREAGPATYRFILARASQPRA